MPTKHIPDDTYVAVQQKLIKICTNQKIHINEGKFLQALIECGIQEISEEKLADFIAHFDTKVGC